MDISGVMIVFDEEIILGSRASKISESKFNAFDSINQEVLGEIRIDIRLSNNHKRRHNKKPKAMKGFESNIAIITLVPGTPVEMLMNILNDGIKGLVLRGYGPGNIAYQYLDAIVKRKRLYLDLVPRYHELVRGFHGTTTFHWPQIHNAGGLKPNMQRPISTQNLSGIDDHVFLFINDPQSATIHAQYRADEIGLNEYEIVVVSALIHPDKLDHDYIHPAESAFRLRTETLALEYVFI